jgi:hypothetical protein
MGRRDSVLGVPIAILLIALLEVSIACATRQSRTMGRAASPPDMFPGGRLARRNLATRN